MSLNDSLGDCTAAGAGHVAQQINWYGQHQDAPVADSDVLAMYEAISGYRPGQPSTDVGATLQDALKYWHTTGVGGNKIAAYAQIKATDLATIRACISLFGAVYTGMNFPASAMDQFNAGKPWTVVPRSRVEGGHCVPIGAYDASSFTCVTWGKTQKLSVDFFQRYFDEVWTVLDLDWLTAQGVSPAAIDGASLNANYQALTGQPGPFPTVAPSPVPAPTPAPSDAADAALVAAFKTWEAAKGFAA
ncbi:hypothetical protein ACFXG4_03650 [Nocardia sp. NPDC059246]|uniref:hypothetical protein n=1 Tax=unclassified Nocardia TaxID=2637762 RepID=UPI00368A078F